MGSNVIREEEGEFRSVEWGRSKIIFGPDNVAAQYLRIGITEYAPGTEHKLHRHPNQEEVIYILDGEGITRTNSGEMHISAGSFVFIPADTDHATINVLKNRPMRAIIVKAPPEEGRSDDHLSRGTN